MGLIFGILTLALATGTVAQSLGIQVTKDVTHSIPSTLYGYMWEASRDINHSGDGGLYGELLQNRAFQAVSAHTYQALNAWQTYQGASIDVTNSVSGISAALPNSLQVTVPSGASGSVGFQNTGYWGIKIQSGWKYTGSFYAKSDSFTGSVTVSLVSTSGTTYATKVLTGVSSSWKKFTFDFQPTQSASNTNNVFRVTMDGSASGGKKIYFGLFSLFPPTYRNRPNGMRIDLAEALAGTKPGVWRFPGGNNLEGHDSIDRRWKWNETVGICYLGLDSVDINLMYRLARSRTAQAALVTGLNDVKGLMEYLNWAEDIGAEPILGVWAGLSLSDSGSLPVVPEANIQPYVQEAINEIHFITGDAQTNEWAKLRAQYGRTEPYKLKYIEIGNEDFFGADTYAKYRWKAFVTGIQAAFPNSGFEYLATTYPTTALNPQYTYLDYHRYDVPAWFIDHAVEYDTYPRNGTHLFIGEYAVTSTNSSCIYGTPACGRLSYPTLQGAVAEAAYMTGLERNSDVIFASAYAPSLQHVNGYQWTPDIISFDAGAMVKSTSYYVQQMFATNLGTHVIKTSPAPQRGVPLHWVASHDANNKVVYLKVSNTASTQFTATFGFNFPLAGKSSTVTLLNAPVAATSNTLANPNAVVPKTTALTLASGAAAFNYTFPAQSVAVFKLDGSFARVDEEARIYPAAQIGSSGRDSASGAADLEDSSVGAFRAGKYLSTLTMGYTPICTSMDTLNGITYQPYAGETDLPSIMSLVQASLSEPYVIYTYRYFLSSWPHLAFTAHDSATGEHVGAIVCKQDTHRGKAERGYIAMLVVGSNWRKRGIARHLVELSIDAMKANGADEVALETEFDNTPALALYSALGFLREKRLFRFYMNGKDAFRLVKPLRCVGQSTVNLDEVKETWDGEWRGTGYVFAPLSPNATPAPLGLLYS
ncbi:hypothetical protein CTheo_6139 [Ceratobasidium theobromae]|uniref:non-reducing end alpha-L-arabinofuranosidase n=1 Tax=Ceratobasidium theobromae TaxID=1582974 RepID=A0A5N5QF98_9AGAM|nr:hypothetical protein CTheo_6139 [Ceratobasidium theobromae]